jgi:hypothetical protein
LGFVLDPSQAGAIAPSARPATARSDLALEAHEHYLRPWRSSVFAKSCEGGIDNAWVMCVGSRAQVPRASLDVSEARQGLA